ncbi:MAG: class I SAM-dependent methyltransferase [Methylococcaceae bacterium]|nr:class I SAM-dependent methyltransferase [Methylococcaceae bacterium]
MMNKTLITNGYVFDQEKQVWSKPDYKEISYNDGDKTELNIKNIILNANDLSVLSTELSQHCNDWASTYHLSSSRANILRPFFHELQTTDILEIGSGCGAITRYLGECGGNVIALEGSLRRADITRARTRDIKNVTVIAEKFDDFQYPHKFDVITLIGVLEYANLYVQGENPAITMLTKVCSMLKPNGKLFIAIENQLGLKYFAGSPEDHLGKAMYGIEGRYQKDQPQTFGRATLSEMLKKSGFSKSEFFVPFPDYKLPVSILTEQGFNQDKFDAKAFAWQSARRDPQLPPICNFSLELAWSVIFNNKVALDLANSFLIVASPQIQPLLSNNVLAYHYSTDRRPEFCKETIFKLAANKIIIQYNALANENEKNTFLIKYNLPNSTDYIFGEPLAWKFVQIVTKDGWSIDEVTQFTRNYLDIIKKILSQQGFHDDLFSPSCQIPGCFFDALAHNIIVDENGNAFLIDQEWELTNTIDVGYLLFRQLSICVGYITRFGSNDSEKKITYSQFFEGVFNGVGLKIDSHTFSYYVKTELKIAAQIRGKSMSRNPYSEFKVQFLPAESVSQLYTMLINSRSWKITQPLRSINQILKRIISHKVSSPV